ncbi:hypothetical protein [Dictyobacter arantiisoli]|nr:hypothetical protein [Dictyobacter arantiisoli]
MPVEVQEQPEPALTASADESTLSLHSPLADQSATLTEINPLHTYASVLSPRTEQIAETDSAQITPELLPTQPVPLETIAHPELVEGIEDVEPYHAGMLSPLQQSEPLLYYKLNRTTKGSQMLPAVINAASDRTNSGRRKRSRGGCFIGCLSVLIILLLILGGAWIFIIRPYAHNMAETQLDRALGSVVNQLPTQLIDLLPAGATVPISENTINNLIVGNLAPSNPVQNPDTTITSQRIRLSFTLYGYASAIDITPALNSNERLVAKNVNVEGVLGLIMSPDEMTTLLNKHFSDAQNKLGKTIRGVQLKNQQLSLTLG